MHLHLFVNYPCAQSEKNANFKKNVIVYHIFSLYTMEKKRVL